MNSVSVTVERSNDVFKFMAVRQPQKPEQEAIPKIRVLDGKGKSVLIDMILAVYEQKKSIEDYLTKQLVNVQNSIEASIKKDEKVPENLLKEQEKILDQFESNNIETRKKIREHADNFIKSEKFVKNTNQLNIDIGSFEIWITTNKKKVLHEQLETKATELLKNDPAKIVKSAEFQNDLLSLSESLISVHLSQNVDQRKGIRLVEILRIYELIGRIAKDDKILKKKSGIEKILKAIVLMPNDLFTSLKSKIPHKLELPKNYKHRLDQLLEEKLYNLENAYEEFDKVKNSDIVTMEVSEKSVETTSYFGPLEKVKESNVTGSGISPTVIENEIVLSKNAVEKLKPTTKKILSEAGFSLDEISLPEVTSYIEKEMAITGKKIFKKMGSNAWKIPTSLDKLVLPSLPNSGSNLTNVQRFIVGITDLMVVRQEIKKYVATEIAHIENVLIGESKERTHRRLNRTEEFFLRETERTEETEKELETTDRLELQRSSEEVIQQDTSLEAGVNITAKYGPWVEVEANVGYESSTSTQQSSRTSSTFARDVIERSLSKISERVRELQSRKMITEIEEINKHGIDNTGNNSHVRGIYQWLEKIYDVKLFNYGKRLMFDFIIPEPARFFKHAVAENPAISTMQKPIPPEVTSGGIKRPLRASDITIAHYLTWASLYGANVNAPPALYDTIGLAFSQPQTSTDSLQMAVAAKTLTIPDGYEGNYVYVKARWWYYGSFGQIGKMTVLVGNRRLGSTNDNWSSPLYTQETTQLPISLMGTLISSYALNVEIQLRRTDRELTKWQIETYDAIMIAYMKQKSEYDEKVAAANIQEGVTITGRNPKRNREIEREELKKLAISILREDHYNSFGSYTENPPFGYPELNFNDVKNQGPKIQFFEHAFEWTQMVYVFYPYFWSEKSEWIDSLGIDDVDPQFSQFLRAGAARVLIPVRPNFEEAIMLFSKIDNWEGVGQIGVLDPLYVSIIDEIQEQHEAGDKGKLVDEWELKVPTSLVYLKEDGTLPEWSADDSPPGHVDDDSPPGHVDDDSPPGHVDDDDDHRRHHHDDDDDD